MKLFISKFFNKIILIKIVKRKLIDAIAWIKKYFKAASEDNKFFELEIKGINLIKLISNPIQHPNQELEEMVIKVLKKRIKKKNILLEFKLKKI